MKEPAVQTKTPEAVPQKASAASSPVLSTRSAVHPILQLQRAIGNQGVQRFIGGAPSARGAQSPPSTRFRVRRPARRAHAAGSSLPPPARWDSATTCRCTSTARRPSARRRAARRRSPLGAATSTRRARPRLARRPLPRRTRVGARRAVAARRLGERRRRGGGGATPRREATSAAARSIARACRSRRTRRPRGRTTRRRGPRPRCRGRP